MHTCPETHSATDSNSSTGNSGRPPTHIMKRFLITTADERTWKFDRPALFVGEWCLLYSRSHVWKNMDYVIAEPFGVDQKEQNIAYVQSLSDQLLVEVADALNAFHGTRRSVRYWHIVLGHWLQRYSAMLYTRYCALERALKSHEVEGTVLFDSSNYSLATLDTRGLIAASGDDIWNNVLSERILTFLEFKLQESERVAMPEVTEPHPRTEAPRVNWRRRFARMAFKALQYCSRQRDAVIVNSYLPLKREALLHLALGQCPQWWRSPELVRVPHDSNLRRKVRINVEGHAGFERFVRMQLGDAIPTCYLEGYEQLLGQVRRLPWPRTPRFIFTSNNFDGDEIFKVWAAERVEQGVPYFVGQHGNNYGTLLGNPKWPELVTSDRFFTWGWTDGSSNKVPTFMFKTAGTRQKYRPTDGGLLLVENCVPLRTVAYDNYFGHEEYQEEQFRFVQGLPSEIQQSLTVRLHLYEMSRLWSDEQRWQDRMPSIYVEKSVAQISELIAQSRLVVYAYDSTGVLETLALNIPTMCFWRGGLDHLLPSAKPYYELLRAAGILCDSPEQAADRVAQRWSHIEDWWWSKEVQDARSAFCERYARVDMSPIRTLASLLTSNSKRVSGA